MTYNVFGGTLNLAQPISNCFRHATILLQTWPWVGSIHGLGWVGLGQGLRSTHIQRMLTAIHRHHGNQKPTITGTKLYVVLDRPTAESWIIYTRSGADADL